jgi:hypothetical protein
MRDPHEPDDPADADRLDAATLAAWPEVEAPRGFADRVLAARQTVPASQPVPVASGARVRRATWRLPALIGRAVALAVATVIILHKGERPPGSAGAVAQVGQRTRIDVGGRAVAVAEPGTTLAWRIDGAGELHVQQRAGNVFYRVDHGGAFVVDTDAGTVLVRGTCFRVEVEKMGPRGKMAISSAGGVVVGAAVAAAILVTVYEGKVKMANAHGEVDAVAGDRVVMAEGVAPAREVTGPATLRGPEPPPVVVKVAGVPPELLAAPPADASREQLLARDAQLRAQLGELAKRAAPGGSGGGREPVFDLPPEEWADMATRCEVRFDNPGFGLEPPLLSSKDAARKGFSEQERDSINSLIKAENAAYVTTMRALYVEVTGDSAGVDALDVRAMEQEIQGKSTALDSATARRRIALEHAGQEAPPQGASAGPAIERYFRLVVSEGDVFEKQLAQIIGTERARSFREESYQNRSIMNGCDEP